VRGTDDYAGKPRTNFQGPALHAASPPPVARDVLFGGRCELEDVLAADQSELECIALLSQLPRSTDARGLLSQEGRRL
jgi:hypothetical protein